MKIFVTLYSNYIYGLYRIWGHPTINEIYGIKKLKSIACKPRPPNIHMTNLIVCKRREYFCLNYYPVHKHWPLMNILPTAPESVLIKALKSQEEISRRVPSYNLDDWLFIEFRQNFNVPEEIELSDMIADKSTLLSYPELRQSCMEQRNIGP